eukprot:2581135-Amphidinium_carterae.2
MTCLFRVLLVHVLVAGDDGEVMEVMLFVCLLVVSDDHVARLLVGRPDLHCPEVVHEVMFESCCRVDHCEVVWLIQLFCLLRVFMWVVVEVDVEEIADCKFDSCVEVVPTPDATPRTGSTTPRSQDSARS